MKYLIPILLVLSGCAQPKPRLSVCLTPLGIVQVDTSNPSTSITKEGNFRLDGDVQSVVIPRGLCVEVIDK
jgi:hypothetical protein